jgi:O-antigen/teichoic acid export membrane protein
LSELPELLRYGLRLVPSQFFVGATLQVPLWIVAGSSSIAEVGAYSRASTMSQRLDEASFRINEMLFPDLVRLHLAGDHQRFIQTLARTLRLAMVALLFVAALAGGAADPLMSIFGAGFSAAAGALAFLLLAHVFYVAASMVAAAYNSFGKPHYNSAFASIRFFVGLPLTWVFVRNFGITAAAAGLCAGYAAELVVRSVALRRLVHQPHTHALPPATLIRLLVVYLGGFAVTRAVADTVSSPLIGLALALLVGALTYVGLALLTRLIDAHDRSAIVGRVLRLARA